MKYAINYLENTKNKHQMRIDQQAKHQTILQVKQIMETYGFLKGMTLVKVQEINQPIINQEEILGLCFLFRSMYLRWRHKQRLEQIQALEQGDFVQNYNAFSDRFRQFNQFMPLEVRRQYCLEVVQKLAPMFKFSELEENQYKISQCSICCEEYKPNDQIRMTHCHHVLHSACLLQWADRMIRTIPPHVEVSSFFTERSITTPTCPNCKQSLMQESQNDKYKPQVTQSDRQMLSRPSIVAADLQNQSHILYQNNTNFQNQESNQAQTVNIVSKQ
eukprot:403334038